MSAISAAQFISELRDLLLLSVPSHQLPTIVATVDTPHPSLELAWAPEDSNVSNVPSLVESLIDDLSDGYPSVAVEQPTFHSGDTQKKLTVVATNVEADGMPDAFPDDVDEGAGEPIPSDASFPLTVNVGDVAYDAVTYDGLTYTLLRNGEVIEEGLPSVAAAVGALLGHVLPEIADQEARKGTPNPDQEVDKDFLFAISQFLSRSPIVPDDTIRKHLVDFVELTTHRDFNAK